MDFFYNSICHVCKGVKDGKRCGGCKFITYCSKEHQTQDWKRHKKVCHILASSHKFIKLEVYCGYQRWRLYRTQLKSFLNEHLGREMQPFENQIWMFPRACNVCYSRENLKECEDCFCVTYCSKEHEIKDEEVHQLVCSNLKLGLDFDRFYLKYDYKKTEIKLKDIEANIEVLPSNIEECMELMLDMSYYASAIERLYITDIFASVLTIIYGLEKCYVLNNRYLRVNCLVVHIVGADISELSVDWKANIQLLNRWIKNLNTCKLIFIGPDCEDIEHLELNNCNITIECIKDYYHNVKIIDEPDLIVALNSGLHEFQFDPIQDTWAMSLKMLISDRAPLVITSYTEKELEEDLSRLSIFNKKVILGVHKNPYRNQKPIRDWDSSSYAPFFVNGYMAILAGPDYHQASELKINQTKLCVNKILS